LISPLELDGTHTFVFFLIEHSDDMVLHGRIGVLTFYMVHNFALFRYGAAAVVSTEKRTLPLQHTFHCQERNFTLR